MLAPRAGDDDRMNRRLDRGGRPGAGVRRFVLGGLLAATAALPAESSAQIWRSQEGRYGAPIRSGIPSNRGGFVFCRLWYDQVRSMPSGLGWSTDYPAADGNFMTRLEELTPTRIERWQNGEPGIAAVRATDPDLFRCPFLFMTDPGSVRFSEAEVEGLRTYLQKGGFLWADDLWTERAWGYFEEEIRRILPDRPIEELDISHPLFTTHYVVPEIPQIPSFQSWSRSGGGTSEFPPETDVPHIRAIFDDEGRLLVLISYNTDIADGWEREGDVPDFFYNFSPAAYGLAINVFLWAMSH
jgi:hypothetical protein